MAPAAAPSTAMASSSTTTAVIFSHRYLRFLLAAVCRRRWRRWRTTSSGVLR